MFIYICKKGEGEFGETFKLMFSITYHYRMRTFGEKFLATLKQGE